MEEQHARETKSQRDIWAGTFFFTLAGEKIKRDKWIQERTKAIKEQTAKGLEPEIQRLIAVIQRFKK